jgi:hypothetical protein
VYTREEASRIRQEFWTTFGRYMNPVLSSEGLKVNWVNYHTRLKDVYFRMYADNKRAMISISIEHRDPDIRALYFEQFKEFKKILHETLNETWTWQLQMNDEHGRTTSKIYKEIEGVSVFNNEQWPDLISFFKPRIIALDSFWENARYGFEELR